jgi:hypothetical protein
VSFRDRHVYRFINILEVVLYNPLFHGLFGLLLQFQPLLLDITLVLQCAKLYLIKHCYNTRFWRHKVFVLLSFGIVIFELIMLLLLLKHLFPLQNSLSSDNLVKLGQSLDLFWSY